jgi:hypothetical protein
MHKYELLKEKCRKFCLFDGKVVFLLPQGTK